jgi:outer membrane protein assembly factor BamB
MRNMARNLISSPRQAYVTFALVLMAVSHLRADNWPQWLGPQRDGVWRETGILEKFPADGPKVLWRAAISNGYSGPAVVDDKIFVLDRPYAKPFERKPGDKGLPSIAGSERVLCLDRNSGKTLWEQTYDCAYRIDYPAGPRATPVVDRDRVFTLGAMGDLRCYSTGDGKLNWAVNFITNYQAEVPLWGWAAHPLLDGQKLICLVGGTNGAVVAFHRDTGKELWRALTAKEIGYAPPMIYEVAGKRQLIIWHPDAISGLEPESGKVLWTHPYPIDSKPRRPEVTIATPRSDGRRLFLTQYYHGSVMLEPNADSGAKIIWNRHGKPGVDFSDGLHTVMCTPALKDGFIYGMCGQGELRCLDVATGDRKWETFDLFGGKKAPLAHAFIIEHADRFFIWTDQGELILANLSPTGYQEIGRAKLLEPTENPRGRDVVWCHPAFAQRCLYVRNHKEIIAVSLAASK